jgi:PAS domain S-box-containing protein
MLAIRGPAAEEGATAPDVPTTASGPSGAAVPRERDRPGGGRLLTVLGIAAAIALTLAIGLMQVRSIEQASLAGDQVERTHLVRLAIERLRSAVRTAHADAGSYLLAGNEAYLARFNESRHEALRQLARLDELAGDEPAARPRLAELRPAVGAVLDVLTQSVQVPAPQRRDEAARLAGPGLLRYRVDETLRLLAGFDFEQARRLEQDQSQRRDERRNVVAVLVGTNVLLFGVIAGLVLRAGLARARRRLRASEQRYHVLFNRGPLPMWVYDPVTLRLLDVNDAALQRYGYAREEFLRLNLRDLRPAEEVPALEQALREPPAQRYGLEWRHRTRAGEILHVRIFAADTEFDGRRARLVLAEDITAAREAQAETHRLREQLASMLDGMVDAVCLFSRDGRFLFVNERARRLAQPRRPVQIGQKVDENFPEFLGTQPREALQRALDTGEPQRVEEFDFGTGAWGEFRMYPQGDAVLVFITNITKRKVAEGLAREREARLAHLSHRLLRAQEEERRQIAREMHDELGQSLVALKLNLQAALADPALRGQRLEDSTSIVERMIEQVRDRSLDLHPAVLDDVGLLAALDWLCARQSARSGVPIDVRGARPLPRLTREAEGAFFRIVQEALSNSLKHARAGRIEVNLVHDPVAIELTVRDDGCGFDPGQVEREHPESLGLISMRERAELIGAVFAVHSEPGRGTRIVVRLPLPQPGVAPDSQGAAA